MNLLVTGAWSDGKNCITELEAMGHTVVFMQYEKDELPCSYEWVRGCCLQRIVSQPPDREIHKSTIYPAHKRGL